jgi:hypothetical protein
VDSNNRDGTRRDGRRRSVGVKHKRAVDGNKNGTSANADHARRNAVAGLVWNDHLAVWASNKRR